VALLENGSVSGLKNSLFFQAGDEPNFFWIHPKGSKMNTPARFDDTLLRLFTVTLLVMFSLLPLAPILDAIYGAQHNLGRINNFALLIAAVLVLLAPVFVPRAGVPIWAVGGICALLGTLYVMNAAQSENVLLSQVGLMIAMGAIAAGFLSWRVARACENGPRRLVFFLAATTAFLPLPPLLMMGFGLIEDPAWHNTLGYGNVRALGYFSTAGALVCTALLWNRTEPSLRALLLVLGAGAAWTVLFWSGSRAGVAVAAAALMISIPLLFAWSWKGALSSAGALGLGALISTAIPAPDNAFGIFERAERTAQTLSEGNVQAATSGRTGVWADAWAIVWDDPITGHGMYPLHWIDFPNHNVVHSHNLPIEWALSFGIPMAAVMLLLLGAAIASAFKAARFLKTDTAAALGVLVVALPIYALGSATLFVPFQAMLFAMCVGALIGSGGRKRAERHTPTPAPFEASLSDVQKSL